MCEWRPVPGYQDLYEVSNTGLIRYAKTGRIRKLSPDRKGYLRVCLYNSGKKGTHRVHNLVALAFLGQKPIGLEVSHKDEVKTNNTDFNLIYDTPIANANTPIRLNRISVASRDSRNPRAIFRDHDILEIRRAAEAGERYAAIAKRKNTSVAHISSIVKRRIWRHLS